MKNNLKKRISLLVFLIVFATIILSENYFPANAAGYKAQFILESYEVFGDCKLGEESTVKVVFKNTDVNNTVSNILISWTSNTDTIIPTKGKSNQYYIDSVRTLGTIEIEIPIIIIAAKAGYASINFNVEYMSDDSRWTSASYIVFPVAEQGPSLVFKNVNVPDKVMVNTNVLISSYFLNASDKDMFNTTFVVDGEIIGGTISKSFGTVSTKRNAYCENYVSFSSEGEKNITLSLRYEDANSVVHEEIIGQYMVTVTNNNAEITSSPMNADSANKTDEATGSRSKLNIFTICLVSAGVIFLILAVVVLITVIRKKKDSYEE